MNSIVGDRYIAELVQIFEQQGQSTALFCDHSMVLHEMVHLLYLYVH